MNSHDELQQLNRQFLENRANHYSFFGKRRDVFLSRFESDNANKENDLLAKAIWEEEFNRKQCFQDHLNAICDVLADNGCPIEKPTGKGRPSKDKSPWQQAFKWLWEKKFPEWRNKQDSNVSSANENAVSANATGFHRKFQSLIEDKTKDFVGRQYVFEAIKNFLTKHSKGYFIIEGDPGMGKSAILAEYVRQTGCVDYFNVQGQYETAEEFIKTLCKELSERYQLPQRSLPSDAKEYGSFLDQLLAETAQKRNGERVVIAIDALDEVNSASYSTHGNILYLPRYLHEGIYFVMTRRRGVDIPFLTDAPQQLLKLMDYENQSYEDVCTYIQNRIRINVLLQQRILERGETEAEFLEKIAEKSQNNFMYLVYVLKDIEQGFYKDLSLERFPQGLQQYYEFHWQRMGMTDKPLPVLKIHIVYHLAESHQPISCQLISEYVGEQQLTVQDVLEDWEQFLHKLIIEEETCYSIYHASFRDFLHRKDIVQAAGVSLKAIKKQKSDNLWKAMFDDE